MRGEIEFLKKNQTWALIDLPRNQKVPGFQWMFKKKEGIPRVEK